MSLIDLQIPQIMKENFPDLAKGNRLPESPGSPESPKETESKE